MVEYAIVFPLQLLLTLVIIQLAHLFVAQQVIEYSAFCAARAGLADLNSDDCRRAALIPLSRIAGASGVTTTDSITLPGWGTLSGSGAAEEKTIVDVRPETFDGWPVVVAKVTHDYELSVPIGNAVLYQLGDVTRGLDVDRSKYGGAPHLMMKGSCVLAHPWGQ